MLTNQLLIPNKVFYGENSLQKLTEVIREEVVKDIILITDKGVEGVGLTSSIVEILEESKVNIHTFYHAQGEPDYEDVTSLIQQIGNTQCDYILAVGGGSVLDVAKLVSLLVGADYSINELLTNPQLGQKKVKTILIPTTSGTGSEATCNGIVGVPEKGIKVGIVNNAMIPDIAILDVNFVRNLPKKQFAASGVDALAHCVECFTSNKANSFSDLFAGEGAKLIFHNIREAYVNDNVEAKSSMLLGSFYGGVAITSSGTTAVHALSYPLGGEFHIPHGIANAILFEKVMQVNKPDIAEDLARLCDIVYPEKYDLSTESKSEWMIQEIADIVLKLSIPNSLNAYGVTMNNLDFLVEAGSGVKRLLDNNKRDLTKKEITDIYISVLEKGGDEDE